MPAAHEELMEIDDLCDLLEHAFGTRPSTSTVRAALGRSSSSPGGGLVRNLPAPVRTRPKVLFRREDIERWIQNHPRTLKPLRQAAITAAARSKNAAALTSAVHSARTADLSWQDIADAVSLGEDRPCSRQAAHARFRDTKATSSRETDQRS